MPRPTTATVSKPSTGGISLTPAKPFKELDASLPILGEGYVRVTLRKFEPKIEEGKDFNFNFNMQVELVEPWPFNNRDGEANKGYPLFDSFWFGSKSKKGDDLTESRDRKMKELASAFYTEAEQEEWPADVNLIEKVQEKYGAEFTISLGVRPASTNPETGQEYPERNVFKKLVPIED